MTKEALPLINEIIVVEGRDDTNAINRAVRAVTIETHGFGISRETWEKLKSAYESKGLIIFTDPDHAGNEIRRRIKKKFPEAKEAFLAREKSIKGEDIGIENAAPADIREALSKARAEIRSSDEKEEYTIGDLDKNGLSSGEGAKEKREKLGDILGIGYCNGKGLLRKLNLLGIKREDFDRALKTIGEKEE